MWQLGLNGVHSFTCILSKTVCESETNASDMFRPVFAEVSKCWILWKAAKSRPSFSLTSRAFVSESAMSFLHPTWNQRFVSQWKPLNVIISQTFHLLMITFLDINKTFSNLVWIKIGIMFVFKFKIDEIFITAFSLSYLEQYMTRFANLRLWKVHIYISDSTFHTILRNFLRGYSTT